MNDTTRRIIRWRHDPSRDWCLSLCRLSTQLWIRLDDSVHIPFSVCVCVCVCVWVETAIAYRNFPAVASIRCVTSALRPTFRSVLFFTFSFFLCVCVCVCLCCLLGEDLDGHLIHWRVRACDVRIRQQKRTFLLNDVHWRGGLEETSSFFFLPFLFSPLANRIEKLGENQKKKQTNKTNNQRSIHFWDSIARERRSTFRSRYLGATSKTILSISPSHTHTHTHERDDPTTKKKSDSGAESTW